MSIDFRGRERNVRSVYVNQARVPSAAARQARGPSAAASKAICLHLKTIPTAKNLCSLTAALSLQPLSFSVLVSPFLDFLRRGNLSIENLPVNDPSLDAQHLYYRRFKISTLTFILFHP